MGVFDMGTGTVIRSNRTRKSAAPPTHTYGPLLKVRLYMCPLCVPPRQVRQFPTAHKGMHTFFTLHLTLNVWPTPRKQFGCGHCGDISTALKEPVGQQWGIMGAHATLSNTRLSDDWIMGAMVISTPTCQGFMAVCKMTQGRQGVGIPLISEYNDEAEVCDVLVSISDGTGLDRSQKGFIESAPDNLASATQPMRSGAIACPALNAPASNSRPILAASMCRGNAIVLEVDCYELVVWASFTK